MSEILIRFVRGSGWDSRAIEWRTAAWCSHVEAVCPGWNTLGAMLDGGVKVRHFSDRCYRHSKTETWSIPCSMETQFAYWSFLDGQIGKPYDWRAIAHLIVWRGQAKGRKWKAPDSWFCSELQAAAADASGLFKVADNLPGNRIVPVACYCMFTTQPGARRIDW